MGAELSADRYDFENRYQAAYGPYSQDELMEYARTEKERINATLVPPQYKAPSEPPPMDERDVEMLTTYSEYLRNGGVAHKDDRHRHHRSRDRRHHNDSRSRYSRSRHRHRSNSYDKHRSQRRRSRSSDDYRRSSRRRRTHSDSPRRRRSSDRHRSSSRRKRESKKSEREKKKGLIYLLPIVLLSLSKKKYIFINIHKDILNFIFAKK